MNRDKPHFVWNVHSQRWMIYESKASSWTTFPLTYSETLAGGWYKYQNIISGEKK